MSQLEKQNVSSHDQTDILKKQLKILQETFNQFKCEEQEREQYLHDDIQRLKRDLGLELYRKQDAEKKTRTYEDKLRHEQSEYQRIQYDFTKTKHELNTLQVKYEALQLELNEINQKPKTHPIAMFDDRTSINDEQSQLGEEKRPVRSKRRTDEEVKTKSLSLIDLFSFELSI